MQKGGKSDGKSNGDAPLRLSRDVEFICEAILWIARPVLWGITILNNYRQRLEEKEADLEAVKNGYGKELIATFKKMSNDELVNVNPHPFIEFTEYSHPGMYQRIKAINEAIKNKG